MLLNGCNKSLAPADYCMEEHSMDKKPKDKPNFAPGDDDALEAKASEEEIKQGNYTKVTTLSYDEVDPS